MKSGKTQVRQFVAVAQNARIEPHGFIDPNTAMAVWIAWAQTACPGEPERPRHTSKVILIFMDTHRKGGLLLHSGGAFSLRPPDTFTPPF